MKRLILGISMFFAGIFLTGIIFLCTVLNGNGLGASDVFGSIYFDGFLIPFFVSLILIICGLVIAFYEAYIKQK